MNHSCRADVAHPIVLIPVQTFQQYNTSDSLHGLLTSREDTSAAVASREIEAQSH